MNRAGVLSRRCARDSANAPGRGEQRGEGQPSGLGHVGNQAPGKEPQARAKPDVGMDQPTEQLQVVREDEEGPEHHEGDQHPPHPRQSDDPESDRPGQADDGHGNEHRGGNPGAERPPVQLVERMRRQPDCAQEREQRADQPRHADVRGARHAPITT